MDTATRLDRANDAAQTAFHDMLTAGVFPDPDHTLTRAYVQSERLVDSILVDAQWEKAKAKLDAAIAADPEYAARLAVNDAFAAELVAAMNADEDQAGDHFVFPAGVGR